MLSLRYTPLTRQIAALPLLNVARTFATAAKTAKKTPATELAKAKKELKATEKKLAAKTKAIEKKAQEKAKAFEKNAKEKAKKQEAKERKEALKTVRRIGAYTFFVKEAGKDGKGFKELGQEWKNLSEAEKEKLQIAADKYNDEQLAKFPPKPKTPANAYAAFLKENYPRGNDKSMLENAKDVSNKWKQLTPAEKEAYQAPASAKEEYQQALEQWKQQRLASYKKQVASK